MIPQIASNEILHLSLDWIENVLFDAGPTFHSMHNLHLGHQQVASQSVARQFGQFGDKGLVCRRRRQTYRFGWGGGDNES